MKPIPQNRLRRILVRAPNWLGDAVMFIPALRGLHKALQPDEFRILAVSGLGDLFARFPFVTGVLPFNRGDSGPIHSSLSSSRYDAIFLFTNSFRSALDAFRTRCPVRVGYGGNFRSPLLTHPVKKTEGLHMVDYYLNLLSPFWKNVFPAEVEFPLLPSEREFADGVAGLEGAVAVPLGARYGPAKCWPHENVRAFVRLIASEAGRRVVLFGTGMETPQARSLEGIAPSSVVNLVGKTSIGQMAAVMAKCEWVVANDSGPLHVAGAVGVKTIALFGPTDHRRTAPLSDNVRIVSSEADCAPCMKRTCPTNHHCMANIKAEEIYGIICQHVEP